MSELKPVFASFDGFPSRDMTMPEDLIVQAIGEAGYDVTKFNFSTELSEMKESVAEIIRKNGQVGVVCTSIYGVDHQDEMGSLMRLVSQFDQARLHLIGYTSFSRSNPEQVLDRINIEYVRAGMGRKAMKGKSAEIIQILNRNFR